MNITDLLHISQAISLISDSFSTRPFSTMEISQDSIHYSWTYFSVPEHPQGEINFELVLPNKHILQLLSSPLFPSNIYPAWIRSSVEKIPPFICSGVFCISNNIFYIRLKKITHILLKKFLNQIRSYQTSFIMIFEGQYNDMNQF